MIGSMFRKAWYSDSATLSLDFTTGVLDSRLTFTRAANTATVINSSGYVQTVNADIPRFDYDPTTLAPRGLLIEGTATNLAPNSNLQAAWLGGTNRTVTPNTTDVLSPDGTNNAAKVALTSASYCSVYEAISGLANATTYTFSYWIRGTAGNQQRIYSATQGTDLVTQSTLTYTNTGWTRVQITFTSGAVNNTVFIYPVSRPTGTVNDVLYIYGCQLEAGNGASSLIPTGASQVTRNADECSMTGTNFSSWYNQSEGTFLAEYKGVPTGSTSGFVWHADDGTNNQRLFLSNASGNPRNQVLDSGSTQCSLTYSSVLMTNDGKNAFAYAANDFAGSTNGGTVLTDAAGTIPTVDRIAIGSLRGTGSFINTAISRIKFYPTRLPDATLQSLTT